MMLPNSLQLGNGPFMFVPGQQLTLMQLRIWKHVYLFPWIRLNIFNREILGDDAFVLACTVSVVKACHLATTSH